MNPSVLRVAVAVGRRLGPAVATALLAAARSWLADPANEQQRQRLVAMLRDVSIRAGGRAGRMAQQLAQQVELRRRSLVEWEREMIALRGEVARHATGTVRQAAMDAYLTQVGAGPKLVGESRRRSDTRRAVLAALDGEAEAVTREPLGPDERRRALEAIDTARAECYVLSPPGT